MITTITTSPTTLLIERGNLNCTILKEQIAAVHEYNLIITFMLSGNHKESIDFRDGLTIDGVPYTDISTALTAITTLSSSGIIETFIATPGQTIFSPVFDCNASTRVYVGGYRIVAGWSVAAGDIEFVAPMLGGEEVIIENI
jgi:hypothetical protein